uniref:NADH-ubiquinone oxidoreductase chain 2 n=1 Tax=Lasioglossum minutissimum TaxID=1039846 RepID=A0A0S2LSV8_9HYME|nr:NADH dehydrogenase subunit 2 [Lasioglossum minutissimum]
MNLLIYFMLMTMSMLSINTTNLFFLWMFLEISSMSFMIYLNINSIKIYSIMYFLISSMSSILILISILTQYHLMNINYLLMFSLWLKLGMFPLNNWMNFMMKNINYISLIPLLTLMKMIPLMMFIYFIKLNFYILTLLLLMMLPPVIFSFNTSSYTLLMNYSSMYNMPLILIFSFFNLSLMMIYMMTYMIITMYLLLILNSYSLYYKNSLNLNIYKNNFFINLMMFMYAQLPPFSTFVIKWNLINYILKINNNLTLMLMLIIFCSLMMTFNYLNFNNYNYYLNYMKINHKINIKKNNIKLNMLLNISFINFTMMFMYMFME